MANAQVGITVIADTKKAVKAFEDLEKSEKKATQALADLDGKQAGTLKKLEAGVLAANAALMRFNLAMMAVGPAVDAMKRLGEAINNAVTGNIHKAAEAADRLAKSGKISTGLAIEITIKAEKQQREFSAALDETIRFATTWNQSVTDSQSVLSGLGDRLGEVLPKLAAFRDFMVESAPQGGLMGLGMVMDKRFGKDQKRANDAAKAAAEARAREQSAGYISMLGDSPFGGWGIADTDYALQAELAEEARLAQQAGLFDLGGGILGGVNNQRANPFGVFGGAGQGGTGFLGNIKQIAEDAKTTQSVLDSLADSAGAAGGAFAALQAGAVAAFDAAITGGEGMAAAFKKAVASSLRSTAIHAAIKALWEGAEAIAALAGGNLPGAAAHGIAAAKYTATAVAAGAAAAALGGFGGGAGAGGGGGGSGAGGGGGTGFTAPSRDHRDGTGDTIIIQVAADYGDANDLAERIDERLRMGERRGVIRSRSWMGPVRFRS